MEQDQEQRHACKLCKKSFPCGRSLGGHMRSHVMNSTETHHHLKPNKKKLSSLSYGRINGFTDTIYGLKENPNKACHFADSSEDTLFLDKLCKECGKGFNSWKALFGHMKCHSERVSTTIVEDDDSWTTQSDDECLVPNRRKRSSRRIKRYRATDATSSSLSVSANASTSVLSEIEHEQEEVAMCLMMLSRDESHWGGGDLNSVDESSDDFSGFLGSNLVIAKIDAKNLMGNGKVESFSLDSENLKLEDTKSEFGASRIPRNGCLGKEKKFRKVDEEFEFEQFLGKKSEFCEADELGYKISNSSKRKGHDLSDPKMGMDYPKNLGYGALDSQEKKRKFECGTCNKIFHSYQALGGHRASHKKQKINVSENNNETIRFSQCQNNLIDKRSGDLKKNKGLHECPICFRVFSSGQALGGHKRSHLIVVEKAEPIQEEMREFLDLNMPAPGEEESSNSHGAGGFKPWWTECSQKHESPISLVPS